MNDAENSNPIAVKPTPNHSSLSSTERRPRHFPKKNKRRPNMTEMADRKTAPGFIADDLYYLAENEHLRYETSSLSVGHAVILKDESGQLIARQYDLPTETNAKEKTKFLRLNHIQTIQRGGATHFRALDAHGKKFYSRRSHDILIDQSMSAQLAYFSAEENSDDEPDYGDHRVPSLFQPDQAIQGPKKTKGGQKFTLHPADVRFRDANYQRGVTQNTVMGERLSAACSSTQAASSPPTADSQSTEQGHPKATNRNAPTKYLSAQSVYEAFFNTMKDQLTPDMIRLLQRAYTADCHSEPENQYRPEWLHNIAYSLTPKNNNPQLADNLGAASKWVNTEMMVLERIAKWFALNQPETMISILSTFDMLCDSDLIETVHYQLHLALLDRCIQFSLDIAAFQTEPVFRKATDLAQATGIAFALLHGAPAATVETITTDRTENAALPQKKQPAKQLDHTPSIEAHILAKIPCTMPEVASSTTSSSHDDNEAPTKKPRTTPTEPHLHLNRFFAPTPSLSATHSIATIADFETSGLKKAEIIEIGLISFAFSTNEGVYKIVGHYHALNDPKCPIPAEISQLTKIDNALVANQQIDWNLVQQFLENSNLIICHNSKFDRPFFELNTPKAIQDLVRTKPFACTYNDVDWYKRGYESGKLSYLNKKMGFPFVGHRTINDCWATLNLLVQDKTILDELLINMNKETMLGVINAPFENKDLLKKWGYTWSNGKGTRLPKGWWISLPNEYLDIEKKWLNDEILNVTEKGKNKQKGTIETHNAAIDRYAPR